MITRLIIFHFVSGFIVAIFVKTVCWFMDNRPKKIVIDVADIWYGFLITLCGYFSVIIAGIAIIHDFGSYLSNNHETVFTITVPSKLLKKQIE